MSTKHARFTFLLPSELKEQFEEICEARDITPSQVLRQLVKAHVAAQKAAPASAKKQQKKPAPKPGA